MKPGAGVGRGLVLESQFCHRRHSRLDGTIQSDNIGGDDLDDPDGAIAAVHCHCYTLRRHLEIGGCVI